MQGPTTSGDRNFHCLGRAAYVAVLIGIYRRLQEGISCHTIKGLEEAVPKLLKVGKVHIGLGGMLSVKRYLRSFIRISDGVGIRAM